MTWLQPLHDRLLIKLAPLPEKTKGGLVLPESAQERQRQGTVIHTGNGKPLDNGITRSMSVYSGQEVLFPKFVGEEVTVDGETLVVIREEDVIGVIHSPPAAT